MDSTKKTTWGIGLKLTLGLSALIVLSVIIGVLSIFSMLSVQGNSGDLSDQYMPAIQISSKIESSTKNIMLGMRGFSLSNDVKYFQDAQKAMKDMEDALNAGSDLVAKNNKLEDFKKELAQAIDLYKKYTDIIQQTKDANDKVLQARDDLNKAVSDFQSNFNPLYDTETKHFEQVIASGARGAALQESAVSIEKINKISDLVDEIRIGNLKSQAMNDNSYVEKIMPDFDLIAGNCDDLIKITKDSTIVNQLNQIKTAVYAYQKGVQNYFENDKKMADIVAIRSKMGDSLSSFAVNVNAMSIKQGLDTANVNKLVVQSANWFIVIGLIIAMIVGVVLAIVLTRSITGPLSFVTLLSRRVTRGDFEIERKKIASQDELGQLTLAFYEMVDGLQSKAKIIESIAGGNLNNDIKLASEEDALGRSLQTMQNSLNEILSQVNIAVEQIAGGSDQVSTAAQSLSQGATEQASSLEEISASSNEIHSQSKQNAEAATTANQLAKQASNAAKDGNQQMVNLMSLLEKMTKSSEDTKKIVKTIDDIAFQVNLLALNANVEAARAGKYGKGFAVVAEEVRNLAVRSASAVNETTQMVEDSIKNIQEVNATAKNTGTQLEGILVNANKVADFLEEITAASQEQARAMGQINGGLDQIDQVTQSNTASAEESASAAEELSGQAQQLKVMVARFQLSDAYTSKQRTLAGATVKPARVMTTTKQNVPQMKKNSPKEPSDIILNDDFETF